MDFLDKWKEEKKKKVIRWALISAIPLIFLILIVVVIYELIFGSSNNAQSTGENAHILDGETGENAVFRVLCQNCDIDQTTEKNGVMGTEFMKKMSELINFYNELDVENKEREEEIDFILLTTTIGYGKKMEAEIFSDSEKFGDWKKEESLTNKDINHFARISDITIDNAQQYYKWASVMMGSPYAINDINLKGLSGNLITGKVVTTCVPGNDNASKTEQQEELIKEIIRVEKKLSGETIEEPSFWDKILSIFGKKYDSDTKVLTKKLTEMFNKYGEANSPYKDLEPYINLDNYNPELQCPSGQKKKHTYAKFMNYDQYKVYLEKVYIPQNYINCDECIYKNSSDYNKSVLAKTMLKEIFELAEYNRDYLGMTKIDYDNVLYGTNIANKDLPYFTSPIKSACSVTSPYSELRGAYPHLAVDTTITDGNYALYAIADGVVEKINVYTSENIGNTYSESLGTCTAYNGTKNSGIEMYIKHEINGTTYHARYVHLNPDLTLQVGDTVKKGQKVATMGNTGCSTGTHLHFELSTDEGSLNPTSLFSQCNGSEISGRLAIRTTDNFVNPEKCKVNDLSLDEVITGLIKKDNATAAMSPEYVKSLAVVIRTKLMKETNWCNKEISANVDVDIENNSTDLMIYNYVIDTQGMVLNYSGELLSNVDYAKYPCEKLPTDWTNPGNTNYVLKTLGISDQKPRTEEFISRVNNALASYNAGCIRYNRNGSNVTVNFDTIPSSVNDTYPNEYAATITINSSAITQTSKNAQNKFSTVAARAMSANNSYTDILYKFYAAKTKRGDDYVGVVDISTSSGLIDAKFSLLNRVTNKDQGFTYGETLPGTTNIPTGNMSDSELETINNHLKNYVDNAEANAISKGDINPKRARVMAAAYWLIYNPFYRVQYQWGKPLIHDNYDGIGWDPAWSSVRGVECQNFVMWSLWNAGAKSVYPTWSVLQHSEGIHNGDNDFTVKQVLDMGIEPGDVIRRSRTATANGHWAIVMSTNRTECYIEVAHAVSEQEDTKISRYYCGEEFRYQHLYKLPAFYNDEEWKASVNK